ncbi:SAVMC3_10250 family protein [Streptomyces sp. CSDS2]|uniref:SAVMC3_10250 family protein n=1 Tax=Streptomyces sp. CSDS2 TaxID=3055051 RepID=UPI0025AEF68E|nr:SAVMC3_10250 family protein [Streptomyces sp. CSDS2]MDN3264718.1 SAVMC3_10250 family protein [Streptomyces sp. CSDS2]
MSGAKVEMLHAQIPQKPLSRLTAEAKVDLKVAGVSVQRPARQDAGLYERLDVVEEFLEREYDVGWMSSQTEEEPGSGFWFRGEAGLRVSWDGEAGGPVLMSGAAGARWSRWWDRRTIWSGTARHRSWGGWGIRGCRPCTGCCRTPRGRRRPGCRWRGPGGGALGSFPTAPAITALTDLAADPEPETVRAAVDSLARIGPPAAAALCALPGPAVRDHWPSDTLRALVTALAACPGPECTTALARLAHPPYQQSVQAAAERALAGRPAAEALPHLLRLLADPMMRHSHGPALLALARGGAPEAEAIVVEHFEHQRSFVAGRYRDEAREALRVLRRAAAP